MSPGRRSRSGNNRSPRHARAADPSHASSQAPSSPVVAPMESIVASDAPAVPLHPASFACPPPVLWHHPFSDC